MPLPDVPQAEYDQYSADRFVQNTTPKLDQLSAGGSFLQKSGARIAGLGFEPVEVASQTSPLLNQAPPIQLQPRPLPPLPTLPQLPQQPQAPTPTPAPSPPSPLPGPTPVPAPPTYPMPAPPVVGQTPPAQQVPLPPSNRPAGEPAPITPVTPLSPGPALPTARPTPQPSPSPAVQQSPFADQATGGPFAPTSAAPAAASEAWGSIPAQINVPVNSGPTISRAQAQAVVQGTPLEGIGGDIWDLGVQYNVDPAFALSIAKNESAYGSTPLQARNNNVWDISNAAYGGQPVEGSRWGQYPDKRAAAEAFYKLITSEYYPRGQTTVGSVMWGPAGSQQHAYAPLSENSADYPGRLLSTMASYGGETPTAAAPAQTAARAVPTAMAVSQFGDRELTASEAYAACGPAAAVRFAQAYGRNPTLREATDLAKEVGWTPQQGMAGIASEQRLMQKLGLDTRLVAGPQWSQFAAEAQSGNPVTISTPGHYFYADGYNPETGAFHVGQSGLDLRQGKEWMTPQEMEGLMGQAQGGLLASNPTVPASSTVIADTPKSLDDVRKQLSAKFGAPTEQPVQPFMPKSPPPPIVPGDPQVQRLDQAVEMAYIPPQTRRQAAPAEPIQPTLAGGAPPPGPPGGGPFDQIGKAISDAIQSALGNLAGGAPGGGGRSGRDPNQDQLNTNRRVATPLEGTFDATEPLNVDISPPTTMERARAEMERARHLGGNVNLPELPLPDIGFPDLTPPKDPLEALQRAQTDALRRGLPSPGPGGQLGILDPKLGNPFENPDVPITGLTDLLGELGSGRRAAAATEDLGRAFEAERRAPLASAARGAVEGMPASVLEDFKRYASDLSDTSATPPLSAAERAGVAARDPGYLAGTPERAAEDLVASEAANQGTARPNVTAQQIQTLPGMSGAARDLNDFRSAVEAGLPFKDWYSAFSNWVLDMVGKDNLPEALAIFAQTSPNNPVPTNAGAMISMMRAVRQAEREGAFDLASVRNYMRKFIDKDGKLNIREFGRQGSDGGNATMQRIWQMVNGEDGAFATRENVGKLMQGYIDGFIPQAANAKTSSYYENLLNSLVQVYDHFSTNDTWMGQIFGPKGTFKADDPNWYRSMYGLINRVAREMGLPAREIQAAAWTAYRSLMDDNLTERPAVIKAIAQQVRDGTLPLAEGIRRAEQTGYYRDLLRSGTEFSKANDLPGALSEVYANPKFQAALENARNAGIDLKSPPPADVVRSITVEHPGAPTTAAQQRPFPVQGTERAAGQEYYRQRAPGIMLPSLERAGYDPETGRIPTLGNVIHEVEQHGSGGTVRLPGGNADTAQYAAARLGQEMDLPEVAVHLPDSSVQTTAGLALDAPGGFRPEQIDSITRALDDAGAAYTVTPDRQVRVFDINGEGQDWARSTVDALRKSDTTGGTLSAYAGDTARIPQTDYAGILSRVGDRYGTPGSPGVPRGTVGDLATRSRQFERAPYSGVAASERAVRPGDGGSAGPASAASATDVASGARAALNDPDVASAVDSVLGGAQPAAGTPTFAVHAAGAATGGMLANTYTDPDDPNRAAKIAAGAAAGYLGGRVATGFLTRGSAAAGKGLSRSAPEKAWDAWVRRYADKNVDLKHVQEDFQRITKKPWTDEMSVAYLARVDPSNRALVATENAVGQAIRGVDRAGLNDDLHKLVSLEADIATAEGMGTRAEEEMLRGGIHPRWDRGVVRAQDSVDQAQKLVDRLVNAQKNQQRLGLYGGIPTNAQVGTARRSLTAAKQRLAAAQIQRTQATARLPAEARAEGLNQRDKRIFQDGRVYADLQKEYADLQKDFAGRPQQWNQIRTAADQLFDYRKVLLQEMVDSQLLTPGEATNLTRLYPKWAPTRMVDYMYAEGGAGGMPRGDNVSVSSNGLRKYTEAGYAGERENRIASMFREAWDVYARGAQNRTFNAFVDYLEEARPSNTKRIADDMGEWTAHGGASGDLLRPDYRVKVGRDEFKVTGIRNGKKQEWVTNDPYLHAAVTMAPDSPLSGIMGKVWQKGARLVTETATSRNPKWLAKNVMRDAGTYLIGTTAEGGLRGNVVPLAASYGPAMATYMTTDPDDPNRLQKALAAGAAGYMLRSAPVINRAFGPNLLGEMLAGYTDAFRGITRGTFEGPGTQEYLLRGGGMRGGTLSRAGLEGGENLVGAIRDPGGIRIRSMQDLGPLLKDAATFGWVRAIGQRTELGPRVAAMRVAEARGASPLGSMISGRDVTLDFDMGGLWTKEANRYIPFLNAAAQGGMRFTRLARDHPGGLFLAGAALVGGPTLASMQWNRADPQRSKDYDNVADYIKARGPVLMLPWVGTDKDGNRQPLHLDFDLAQFAPFAVAAQETYDRTHGLPGREAGDILGSVAGALAPGGSSNPADIATQVLPPPASTVAQLALNRDFYRGSTIANRFSDERASGLAKTVAPPLEALATRIPGQEAARIRPSQVDFALRDILGGTGQTAVEAADVATGRPPRVPGAPSEIPGIGGLASGFLRTGGSQLFENARQPREMLHENIRQRLRDIGGSTKYYEPSVVPDTIKKIPLRQEEQTEYQRLTNEYFNRRLETMMRLKAFETNEAFREKAIANAMDSARKLAEARMMVQIRQSGSSLAQRRLKESSAF